MNVFLRKRLENYNNYGYSYLLMVLAVGVVLMLSVIGFQKYGFGGGISEETQKVANESGVSIFEDVEEIRDNDKPIDLTEYENN